MEFIDNRLKAVKPSRVHLRIRPAVTKPEGAPSVEIELVEPQALGKPDPVRDRFLGNAAKVEKV